LWHSVVKRLNKILSKQKTIPYCRGSFT
jgi:hypothetical protein